MEQLDPSPQSILSRLISTFIFPVIMCLSLFAVLQLLNQGIAQSSAVFYVLVPAGLCIWMFESILPFRQNWNRGDNDVVTDSIHMFIAQFLIPRLMGPLWALLAVALISQFNLPQAGSAPESSFWPHQWPLISQLFLMLVIAEFGRYWVHRAAHEISFLWRFHAVHHSPNRLYFLNAGRFHPLEKVLFLIPEALPFAILGVNIETLALYFVFNGVHGLFQHSNIKVKLGPLNYLFSMSELHRWHHSKVIGESNRNYGNNLIIWDILFGTYFNPKNKTVTEVGLQNPTYPKNYTGQLLAPFSKDRLDKLVLEQPSDKEEPAYDQ